MKSSPKTKVCTKCGIKKKLGEFYFISTRQRYNSCCKLCANKQSRKYHRLNKVKVSTRAKEYYQLNKTKINAHVKEYTQKNKEKKQVYLKKYYQKNKLKLNANGRAWHYKNQAKVSAHHKKYRQKNRVKMNLQIRLKKQTDINFKIACALRSRIYYAMKSKAKTGSAVRDLGCSIEEFKNYIAVKFKPGMTWKNWGVYTWHLDHIRPLASFNLGNREEFLVAFHYTNYQPLWAKDNLSKGDRILNP